MDHYVNSHGLSIFESWERGHSVGNSTTPSVTCQAYRGWMTGLLNKMWLKNGIYPIVSLGCGNAFVEADLVRMGVPVKGIDCHEEAVRFAREKGVDAALININEWRPSAQSFSMAYCDGIFGHLYQPESGLKLILDKLRHALIRGGKLIISNDPAIDNLFVHEHPDIPGFYWFSAQFLVNELENNGFKNIETQSVEYLRPVSGPRSRLVVIAESR